MSPSVSLAQLVEAALTPPAASMPSVPRAVTCVRPTYPCGDRCVALGTDPLNCGQCGHKVRSFSQRSWHCPSGRAFAPLTPQCETGVCRNGACAAQCASGNDCPWYFPCINGLCQCPTGQTLCYRQIEWFECADLQTDRGHCGDCDTWVSRRAWAWEAGKSQRRRESVEGRY